MAEVSWTNTVPAGVLKNHALSNDLLTAAIAETQFLPFTTLQEGFGRHKGETVSWPRMGNIAEQATIVLNELERIPEDSVTISTRSSTIQEVGRKVPYTNFASELMVFNLKVALQRRLRDNLSLGLDTMAATAFKDTQIRLSITGLNSRTWATNGTFAAASTANMNLSHVEAIHDYMYDTLHVPPYENGRYKAIFRQLGIRGILDDPSFTQWWVNNDPQVKVRGEVGSVEMIDFIATNHAGALANVGTGSVLGSGVVFGDDPVRRVEVMAPELMAAEDPTDFGRSKFVGFYGMLRFTSTWGDSANAGEANIVYIGSL